LKISKIIYPILKPVKKILIIYQSSLENGNPTPVDAQGRVGIDDGGVGEVVAINGNELVDIRL